MLFPTLIRWNTTLNGWQRAATTLESNNSHCPSLAGDSFSGTTAIGASSPTASGVIPLLGPSIEITAAPSLELRALSLHYRTTTIHDSDVLIACICALVEGGRGLGTISQEGGELSIKRFSFQRVASAFPPSTIPFSLSLSPSRLSISRSVNQETNSRVSRYGRENRCKFLTIAVSWSSFSVAGVVFNRRIIEYWVVAARFTLESNLQR